jgi:hypothetical protein
MLALLLLESLHQPSSQVYVQSVCFPLVTHADRKSLNPFLHIALIKAEISSFNLGRQKFLKTYSPLFMYHIYVIFVI